VNPTLQGYTAAVVEAADPAELGAIAGDLDAVDRLVLDSKPLLAALSDTAVPGSARRSVILDLLEGKVRPEARRLAAYACTVVSAQDVTAALSWLSTRVRHAAEGLVTPEPPLSLTQSRARVAGFAGALHEGMSTSELESMEDDLFRFARIVGATPALRSALTDRDLPVDARRGMISELLKGKVPPTTMALVRYAVTGGRARDFVGTLDFLVERTAAARGWRIAHVRAAAPLDEAQRGALTEALSSVAGAPVELQVEIDESLLSGARVRIGDLQVDATARGRIDEIREHLAPVGWEPSGFGPGRPGGPAADASSAADNKGAQ
jgi:F-type H+-transporting ATPase subunit delta